MYITYKSIKFKTIHQLVFFPFFFCFETTIEKCRNLKICVLLFQFKLRLDMLSIG